MATAMELAMERAFTARIYAKDGQSVTYESQSAAAVPTTMVSSDGSEDFPGEFESSTSEDSFAVRMLKEIVTQPRRGDKVTDSDGRIFEIDTYRTLNNVEWAIILRLCKDA